MKGSNAISSDHAASNRARKSKASRAEASHRYLSLVRARASAAIAFALANIKITTSSPTCAIAVTASVITRHHRQQMPLGKQLTTGSVATSIQSGITTKIL
jgi:hypothetical protein